MLYGVYLEYLLYHSTETTRKSRLQSFSGQRYHVSLKIHNFQWCIPFGDDGYTVSLVQVSERG